MKHLKIMVKETKEERREFTEDERFIMSLIHDPNVTKYTEGLCNIHMKTKGWHPLSMIVDGTYKFRIETLREATPEEILAYHTIEIYETSCFKIKGTFCKSGKCPLKSNNNNLCIMCSETRDKARQLLAGKEIILELVEE